MTEINPESEPLRKMRGNWQKVIMLMMHRSGKDHVIITPEDIDVLNVELEDKALVVQELEDGLHLTLMDYDEAMDKARANGDLNEKEE